MRHPAIAQTGVTSVTDKVRGEEVIACVILRPGQRADRTTAEGIVTWCLERLAYYKAPGWVSFMHELPLTPTLKIQRTDLKKAAEQQLGGVTTFDTRNMKKRDAVHA
jgi:acyl-coenzyme A synthetase/AMP-(fatty) acid ligase